MHADVIHCIHLLCIQYRALAMVGLVVIALGTGGIKPCVSAFGGDQFIDGQVAILIPYVYVHGKSCMYVAYINMNLLIRLTHTNITALHIMLW